MLTKSIIMFSSSADFLRLMKIRLIKRFRVWTSCGKDFRSEILRFSLPCCIVAESGFLDSAAYLELRHIASQELHIPLFIFSSGIHNILFSDAVLHPKIFPVYGNNHSLMEQIAGLPVMPVLRRDILLRCNFKWHLARTKFSDAPPYSLRQDVGMECREPRPLYTADDCDEADELHAIVGHSPAIAHIKRTLPTISKSSMAVLILGPSGAGKTFFAEIVHKLSGRKGAFCSVNIAAIPKELLATALFGSKKGAFTDAVDREGYFSVAHGGTLFLDEIGDMPFDVQAMLLHVLESKQFAKVGSHELHTTDVRMICATNKGIREMIDLGTFREDLYYRINGFPITVPSLKEHPADIPLLANAFLLKEQGRREFAADALKKLCQYSWPGNIRQLRNCVERACILCRDTVIQPEHILLD